MVLVRWVLPLTIVAVGVVLMSQVREGVGLAIACAGVIVLLANVMLRYSFASDRERDREEEARAFYDAHGHWPDERPR